MSFAVKLVSARSGYGSDGTAKRPGMFGRDARSLDRYLFEVFDRHLLAQPAVDDAVRPKIVHIEVIFGAAGAVDLNAAFNFAGIDAGCGDSEVRSVPIVRKPVELVRA